MKTYIIESLDLEDIQFLAGWFTRNRWTFITEGRSIKVVIPKIDQGIFNRFLLDKYLFHEV